MRGRLFFVRRNSVGVGNFLRLLMWTFRSDEWREWLRRREEILHLRTRPWRTRP